MSFVGMIDGQIGPASGYHTLLGTVALPVRDVLFLLPSPSIVWSIDELHKAVIARPVSGSAT